MNGRPSGALELHGIAASHGVVVGPAIVLGRSAVTFPRRRVGEDEFAAEWQRFHDAVALVQDDLRATLARLPEGRAEASILDAYVLMVGDETLAAEVQREIYDRGHCAR